MVARTALELITEPLPNVVTPDYFTPRVLLLLNNALVWRESTLLRQAFGLGTNDWRVISALATRPGSTATEVTEFLDANKAVVSKAVNALLDRDLIASSSGARGSRHLFLTRAGAEMHDAMLPISMEGDEILVSGLTEKEVRQLHALLDKMMAKRPELAPAMTGLN
jgi:DNA-binding MarR family transcriptional regulator